MSTSKFLTIINESFGHVRIKAKVDVADDQHIVTFVINKLRRSLGRERGLLRVQCAGVRAVGIGMSQAAWQLEKRDVDMRSKCHDSVDHFPDKVDELLDALNRVCPVVSSRSASEHALGT